MVLKRPNHAEFGIAADPGMKRLLNQPSGGRSLQAHVDLVDRTGQGTLSWRWSKRDVAEDQDGTRINSGSMPTKKIDAELPDGSGGTTSTATPKKREHQRLQKKSSSTPNCGDAEEPAPWPRRWISPR